ncbi:MAG: hypothetical protein IH946_06695, partial [Bacteroidetes bacterium]|nr:hypothetical protein [Bacteroidota bacterium]
MIGIPVSSKAQFVLLLTIFLISVLVRWPNIDRPLSKHHEFCTAFTLIILENNILYDRPLQTISLSYPLPTDKYINNFASRVHDDQGNYYYISHPPFGFIFPGLIYKALGLIPSVLSLQLINLLFHFLSGLVVFLICRS